MKLSELCLEELVLNMSVALAFCTFANVKKKRTNILLTIEKFCSGLI